MNTLNVLINVRESDESNPADRKWSLYDLSCYRRRGSNEDLFNFQFSQFYAIFKQHLCQLSDCVWICRAVTVEWRNSVDRIAVVLRFFFFDINELCRSFMNCTSSRAKWYWTVTELERVTGSFRERGRERTKGERGESEEREWGEGAREGRERKRNGLSEREREREREGEKKFDMRTMTEESTSNVEF